VHHRDFAQVPATGIVLPSPGIPPGQEEDKMTTRTFIQAAGIAASLVAASPASAADMMAKEFADARIAAFGKGDVETLLAQYADDATVFTPGGVLHGKEQIRPMMEAVVAEFAQPGVTFNMVAVGALGQVVTFTWTAETNANVYELGSEAYVLADGKAVYQTLLTRTRPK
jgi:uncharacterized protein (TIGR02246 family)